MHFLVCCVTGCENDQKRIFSGWSRSPHVVRVPVARDGRCRMSNATDTDEPINTQAFTKALLAVSFAEVFDKTWFVTLVMSIQYNKCVSFVMSLTGLWVHVFIAAGLGYAISQIPGVRDSTLDFICAGVMLLFAVWYGFEAYTENSDTDVIAEGRAEIEEDLKSAEAGASSSAADGKASTSTSSATEATPMVGKAGGGATTTDLYWPAGGWCSALHLPRCDAKLLREAGAMFGIIFMAEWGDRTQFVMISLHASQPLWPVVIGSALAFLILCTSAVLCAWFIEASVVEMKLSKKTLNCIVAVAFVAFAIVSLIDGIHAMELGTDSSTRRPYKHSVQAQADADAWADYYAANAQ